MAKKSEKKFNYAVGSYWEGDSGAVGCYASGSEVFFGSLKEAKKFKKYCESKDKNKPYKIFMLVEIPE
jgi:hypothetical protein